VKSRWRKLRYRLEWLGLKLLLRLVPLLPRAACYRLAGFAGSLTFALDRHGRTVTLSNLAAAFGDDMPLERRREIARESYRHFARTMLDLFWSPRLTAENFRDYIEFEGLERFRADIAPSNSCMVGAFHYGNFEWLSLACGWIGVPGAITTQEFKNPLLDEFFQQLRERSGHRTVPREGAIVRLYKTLRRKGRVALLVDTTLPPHHPTVVINCFGFQTIVTVAHAWLQQSTGTPLIPAFCEPLPRGRYRVIFQPALKLPPGATHQQIAQACWDSFEPVLRRNPAPWMWMYKYWRYKPAGAAGYPFYAHESWAFDQIAARPNYTKLDRSAAPAP
jgi:Kdo2-lipid IVA lauroyltransferase/acyltransferase